jgi:hypothetical protein
MALTAAVSIECLRFKITVTASARIKTSAEYTAKLETPPKKYTRAEFEA